MAYIVAIDIGSTHIATVIGEYNPEANELEIRGVGVATTRGYRKGKIDDTNAVGASIARSVEIAGLQAGITPLNAFAGISGITSRIINNNAEIPIRNKKNIITHEDLAVLMSMSKDVGVDEDEKVAGVIPLQYNLDGRPLDDSPVGQAGNKLAMNSAVAVVLIEEAQKLEECMKAAGIGVSGLIPSAMALEEKLLTREEKENGAVLIDVGGMVTDIALVRGNEFIFSAAIPIGGNHITSDIALIKNISKHEAEEIKKNINYIQLPSKDKDIPDIIRARLQEIFAISEWTLEEGVGKQWDVMGAVITGRGAAYLPGCREIAQHALGIPVRLAIAEDVGVVRPERLAAISLAEMICRRYAETGIANIVRTQQGNNDKPHGFMGVLKNLIKKFYIQ